ncbi:Exodeoxyribonuclease I [Tepidimonas alkaliphilus]|uniref:Exodeoxyribonuclease I n=1 Tax=Tepidimonas alkaliphilus TaxID=2588942 RepID=A0A554W8Q5_9BURK|nr:exodeoxyribonuclease I [Tepidimonas alkaliphilus]TSE19949.1 Exodeoxyribonuclease I [Tepidimonas alkaliphilus]
MQAAPTTFYWHDYETFGRDPRQHAPAQFAGVRTDAELREIDAPLVLYCRPSPDRLPDPWSCVLTGLTPQMCERKGVAERVFAERIEAQLAQPGTIGVGYNSLRFDDEFTRHLLWRNLLDPYAREWRDGCGRWDLFDAMCAAWALRPDGIEWPQVNGQVSLKLEHLSAANGLVHDQAHDALSDVRATLALARLLRARQPRLFEFALSLRDKERVRQELGLPNRPRPFVHVSPRLGAQRGFLAVMWPLAPHPYRRHEVIAWDLAHDPSELADLRLEEVRARLFLRREEERDDWRRLPIKTVHLNRAPFVVGDLRLLQQGAAQRWGIDLGLIERHARRAARLPDLSATWAHVWAPPSASAQPSDVDGALYAGWLQDADRRRLQRLRTLDPADPAWRHMGFDDSRLGELVFRFRARNHPETLDEDERQRWRAHCRRRLLEGADGGPTLTEYLAELQAMEPAVRAEHGARGAEVLQAVREHALKLAAELQ